jgi:hypothetical protein
MEVFMTSQQLPERPNLEQLKYQAKTLLRAAHAQDATALHRFRALPALADKTVREIGAAALALHDAQSVIAREHGFVSWNELREHVEALTLSFASAVDEFVRCATGDAAGRARRLLALHPGIAHASLQAERVLIAAGSSVDWTPPTSAPSPEGTLETLAELVRAARNSAQS